MKTQINQLVKGDHRKGISGTNRNTREEIAKKVCEENEDLVIRIKGVLLKLKRNTSVSGKTITFYGSMPLDLYREFFGEFGIPKANPAASILIQSDMSVTVHTNSKGRFFNYISESEIFIL